MASETEDDRPRRPGVGFMLAVVTVVTIAVIAVVLIAGSTTDEEGPGDVTLNAQQLEGRKIFNQSCAQCHILEASNSTGQIGPNLDQLKPPRALIVDAVENGRSRGSGNMPADLVTGEDVEAVAAYVSAVAGVGSE